MHDGSEVQLHDCACIVPVVSHICGVWSFLPRMVLLVVSQPGSLRVGGLTGVPSRSQSCWYAFGLRHKYAGSSNRRFPPVIPACFGSPSTHNRAIPLDDHRLFLPEMWCPCDRVSFGNPFGLDQMVRGNLVFTHLEGFEFVHQ